MNNRTQVSGGTALMGCLLILALAAFVFVGSVVIGGWILSLAWNETMSPIFDWARITWQQGAWLVLGLWVVAWPFKARVRYSGDSKEK